MELRLERGERTILSLELWTHFQTGGSQTGSRRQLYQTSIFRAISVVTRCGQWSRKMAKIFARKSRQFGQGRDTGFPFYLLRNEFIKIVDKDWYTYSFSIILSIIFYFKGAILLLCNIENIFFCRNILKRFHFPLGVDIMILYFAFNLSSKPS